MKVSIKVSDIVNQSLFEFGEQTTHLFERALYHALQLVKDVALDGRLKTQKAVILPVDSRIRTVVLPADFVDAIRVAYMQDGKPKEIGRADRSRIRVAGKEPKSVGQGQSTQGYSIDFDKGILLLPSDVACSEVMLAYVCAGINPTGDTCVHPYLEAPMLAYIYWKLIERRKDYSMSQVADAERKYHRAMTAASLRDNRFTVGEFLTATRAGYEITLKG